MKNLFNTIKEILLWIWQLPQNIGGLILPLCMGWEKKLTTPNGNKIYFSSKMSGGIPLGKYSIVSDYYIRRCKTDIDILNLDVSCELLSIIVSLNY